MRQNIHQTLRIRTVTARPDGLTRDSSSERPLPADLCGLRSQQAVCSLRCACGMHVRSRRLLDCAWKAAAGGTSVQYHRDRATPTTTAAQNGPLGQRHGMRLAPGPRACTQSTFGLLCCATASVSARECPIGCAFGLLLCRQPENLSVRLISRQFRCQTALLIIARRSVRTVCFPTARGSRSASAS